jgi:hypothetical protein
MSSLVATLSPQLDFHATVDGSKPLRKLDRGFNRLMLRLMYDRL